MRSLLALLVATSKAPPLPAPSASTTPGEWEEKFLGSRTYAGRPGAFEGAMYEARGYYRPQADCVMFTRDRVPFCAVCQQALTEVIDLYTGGPVRSGAPTP